jgi:hypothetical protein
MGRTSTTNKPLPLNNSPKQLSVSWESNPARVIAREKEYLVQILKYLVMYKNYRNSIQWTSGYTGLPPPNQPCFESAFCRAFYLN